MFPYFSWRIPKQFKMVILASVCMKYAIVIILLGQDNGYIFRNCRYLSLINDTYVKWLSYVKLGDRSETEIATAKVRNWKYKCTVLKQGIRKRRWIHYGKTGNLIFCIIIVQFIMSANSRIRFGCTLHHLIIIIVETCLKTLNAC